MTMSSSMVMQRLEMSMKIFLGVGVTGGPLAYLVRYFIGVQETSTDQEGAEEVVTIQALMVQIMVRALEDLQRSESTDLLKLMMSLPEQVLVLQRPL